MRRQVGRLLQGLPLLPVEGPAELTGVPPGGFRHSGVSGIVGPVGSVVALGASGNMSPLLSWPPQVTLECPGHEEVPRVDKLVEKILHCSCQACGKEPSHGLSVYVQGEDAPGSQPGTRPHPHPGGQTPEPEDPPGAPHAEEEGAED